MKKKMTFKRWITSTALVFIFQQTSTAFAMEAPEEENYYTPSKAATLPKELISAQQTLQNLIFESTKARPDSFTPLLSEIRGVLNVSSQEIRELVKNKFPNLLKEPSSLLPHVLLREKKRIPFDTTLSPDHIAFERLQEVISLLLGFQQHSLLVSHPLKEKLQQLQVHYQEYIDLLCRIEPPERLPYLSALPLTTEFSVIPYVISKEMAYDLLSLNKYGLITKRNPTGTSPVAKVGRTYVKQNLMIERGEGRPPEETLNPGMEWAMSAFHRLLFGEGLVGSSLIFFPSVPQKGPLPGTEGEGLIQEASNSSTCMRDKKAIINRLYEERELGKQFVSINKSYVAQATEEVQGEFLSTFLERALQDPSLFDSLDISQVQSVILSSFLLAFGDAKGDNLMVTFPDAQGKRQIISISNDWALESFILEERPEYHVLGARNLLFFIPELMNQGLSSEVREHFLSQSPGVFLLKWLRALKYHNARYHALKYTHSQALKDTGPHHFLHLNLKPGTAKNVLERFTLLQQVLQLPPDLKLRKLFADFSPRTAQLPSNLTPLDLFANLSPLAALYCQDLVAQETDSLKAFDKAYNRQAFFEHVLGPKLSQTYKGITIQEALRKERTPLNAYKNRTQSLEEAAQEVLDSLDFKNPQETLVILEEASAFFPDSLIRTIRINTPLRRSCLLLIQDPTFSPLIKPILEKLPKLKSILDNYALYIAKERKRFEA